MAIGERAVEAVLLPRVADFIGMAYESPAKLSPEALFDRLQKVFLAVQRYVCQVPEHRLGFQFPDRDRTFRSLAYHTFKIGEALLEGYRTGRLPFRIIMEEPPDILRTGEELATFGDEVLSRFRKWWEAEGTQDPFTRPVQTYYGIHPLHDVFERTTWHAAQHARQIILFLEHMGIEPDGRLTDDDLAGLPLPRGVWD